MVQKGANSSVYGFASIRVDPITRASHQNLSNGEISYPLADFLLWAAVPCLGSLSTINGHARQPAARGQYTTLNSTTMSDSIAGPPWLKALHRHDCRLYDVYHMGNSHSVYYTAVPPKDPSTPLRSSAW